jgi:hypothetical protein
MQFTEIDFLSRGQAKEDMLNDNEIRQKAYNTKEKFKFAFEKNIYGFRQQLHKQ